MGKSKGSLKGYEFSNLLFLLVIMTALGFGCWAVFHYFSTKDWEVVEIEPGISSEEINEDIAMFYLEGFKIVGVARTYRSRLEIPTTDDGLISGLFNLPGVEELVIQPESIIVKKNGTVGWDKLSGPIRDILKNHLHSHY